MTYRLARGRRTWNAIRVPLAVTVLAVITCGGAPSTLAAAFPERPLALVVPFPTGGGSDIVWRIFASFAEKHLGQPIEVQNIVGGANGSLGTAKVAAGRADGYTLLGTSGDSITVQPNETRLPYTYKSFVPIAQISTLPIILASGANSPVKSVADLKAYTKAHPNQLTVGISGIGGEPQLCVASILHALGDIRVRYIPFSGSGAPMAAVLGGTLDMVVGSVTTVLPQVQAGKLYGLFVTSLDPAPQLPNVPGAKALGVGYASLTEWRTAFAPAPTPVDVVRKLNAVFAETLADPGYAAQLTRAGDTPGPITDVAELERLIARENQTIRAVIPLVMTVQK
jgi:tripartite-type tricarboxylate transporter receptor subunit TctC